MERVKSFWESKTFDLISNSKKNVMQFTVQHELFLSINILLFFKQWAQARFNILAPEKEAGFYCFTRLFKKKKKYL